MRRSQCITGCMDKRSEANTQPTKRFVSQRRISELTGRSERTLEKDRLFGRGPFPHYKCGSKILYDEDECLAIVTASRVSPEAA